MRIILVGPPHARAQLRLELVELHGPAMAAGLSSSVRFDVVGEFATVAKARASSIHADALLVANDRSSLPAHGSSFPAHGSSPQEEWIEDDWIDDELTPRELEVLELLAEGLPNKAIGSRLKISDQTVKFHVASIIGKLGASNRTDAARRAARRGLISL
jgi:DNA-binding NarL/FixJ family response regulator